MSIDKKRQNVKTVKNVKNVKNDKNVKSVKKLKNELGVINFLRHITVESREIRLFLSI